jgi:hypothetical protein
MVSAGGQCKRSTEQLDADADVSESPARVFCHGDDTSARGHVEAPGPVDTVTEFQVEDFGPFVVGLAGRAVAVSGEKEGQVTRGLRFSRDDAVVEVQQGLESGHCRRLRHARHVQHTALHTAAPVQPHHRQGRARGVPGEECDPPHRQVGGGTDRDLATGHQWHMRTIAVDADALPPLPTAATFRPRPVDTAK